MKQITFGGAVCAFSLALSIQSNAIAKELDGLQLAAPVSPRKNIRFYKVNKQLQADRIMLTEKKASTPGCQNFLKSVRVHRVVQTGHTVCTLYTEKDCKAFSIVNVASEKDPRNTTWLTEGIGWLPQSEQPRGVKISSWNCASGVEPEQIAHEYRLASAEVDRLALIAKKATERAALAQNKANKAQKNADRAIEQAGLAKRRAIAAGVVIEEEEAEQDTPEKETAGEDGSAVPDVPGAE
ncbi:MAG: hypothetical protein HKN85_02430 [Gammaproteobacteria bacterium]|nr:hypothetical protein [Gammaproteobacteria bacterium]